MKRKPGDTNDEKILKIGKVLTTLKLILIAGTIFLNAVKCSARLSHVFFPTHKSMFNLRA